MVEVIGIGLVFFLFFVNLLGIVAAIVLITRFKIEDFLLRLFVFGVYSFFCLFPMIGFMGNNL